MAYLVQLSNIVENRNDVAVEVKSLDAPGAAVRTVYSGSEVSGLEWADHGKALAVLAP